MNICGLLAKKCGSDVNHAHAQQVEHLLSKPRPFTENTERNLQQGMGTVESRKGSRVAAG